MNPTAIMPCMGSGNQEPNTRAFTRFISAISAMHTTGPPSPPLHARMQVTPGSIFVLHSWLFSAPDEMLVSAAVEKGAACIVLPAGVQARGGLIPASVAVLHVDDAEDVGQRLAMVYYGERPCMRPACAAVAHMRGACHAAWQPCRHERQECCMMTASFHALPVRR